MSVISGDSPHFCWPELSLEMSLPKYIRIDLVFLSAILREFNK